MSDPSGPRADQRALDLEKTADWYRRFRLLETPGQSALYAAWADGVENDAEVLGLIVTLPRPKRQPNLVFTCARLLGAPLTGYRDFRPWLVEHWPAVAAQALLRSTQTNEPRRLTAIMPVLAGIGPELALLEVGASAGLCLYPDRYSYDYSGRRVDPVHGPSTVLLTADATGPVPLPTHPPEIVWRAGLDLNPLDVHDPDDVVWLQTLVWPEQTERRDRLDAALTIARLDPPLLTRGDAVVDLEKLVALAPAGVPLVIVSPAVLVYLAPEQRTAFARTVAGLGHWISLDGAGVLPQVDALLPQPPVPGDFTVSLDGRPVARCGPHGQSLDWIVG
ncbi:DUF2332 domain-containing protein [Cryobacterium lactosi]|uniref:DUF2332 domain-containing protein n=1 Tax=Cryobacterium lactosi TaxID=1259202 RepID=A0A4R9BPG8_9MICO|nr:DUF2332 domain-containing protein [Cryobacterium lactosi]TFD88504.1 DUF2332 domain-containing protein [Cryobacterium lactosi]